MYSIHLDDKLIYASNIPSTVREYALYAPKLTTEIGKSGSLTFGIPSTNKYFGKFKLMKSVVSIRQNGRVFWKGRVLDGAGDFFRSRTFTVPGIMDFLNDSVQEPETMSTTLLNLFHRVIDKHNEKVEPYKRFTIGAFTMDNVEVEYSEGCVKTMELLTQLIEDYGGYLSVTYGATANLINWHKEVEQTGNQVIRFGEGLLDFADAYSGEDVVTCLIPYGKDGLQLANKYIKSDLGCDLFGQIWDTITFSDIDKPELLEATARIYLNNLIWSSMNLNISAADLLTMGVKDVDKIESGKKYKIISPPHKLDYPFPCTKAEIDIQNPGASAFAFEAQTIWTQLDDTKMYSQLLRDHSAIKMVQNKSLTSRGSATEKSVSTKGGRFTGTVQFSDNTNLQFEKGILVGGSSSEGEF